MYKKLIYIILGLILLLFFGFYGYTQSTKYSDDTINYFLEIALGSEYGDDQPVIKKWTQNINIAFQGETVAYLSKEVMRIIEDLNQLIDTIEISIIEDPNKANFIIYYGRGEDYVKELEAHAEPFIEENWGFFWVYWSTEFEIFKGSLYIDIERVETITSGRHMIREELTQSLGFLKESDKYRTSIFYNDWSTTIAYNIIDKEVIQILYNEKIKPGMKKDQILKILNSL